jgi:hypothetical protein
LLTGSDDQRPEDRCRRCNSGAASAIAFGDGCGQRVESKMSSDHVGQFLVSVPPFPRWFSGMPLAHFASATRRLGRVSVNMRRSR